MQGVSITGMVCSIEERELETAVLASIVGGR
jgi:hypothetical protein